MCRRSDGKKNMACMSCTVNIRWGASGTLVNGLRRLKGDDVATQSKRYVSGA